MDNGQDTHRPDDLFEKGITSGTGISPDDMINSPDNLNSDNFINHHNYGRLGNQAISTPEESQDSSESSMSQDITKQSLGQIIDLPVPPLNTPSKSDIESKPHTDQDSVSIDPSVFKRIAGDGKVNNGDVKYLENEIDRVLVEDGPAGLNRAVMTMRDAVAKADNTGDAK